MAVPASHKLASQTEVTPADLDGEPMIERIDCCLGHSVRDAFAAAGIKLEIRHRAASEEQLQHMVLAGFGAAIAPSTVVLAGGLVGVPLVGELRRDVILAAAAGRRFPVAVDTFVKMARAKDWSRETETVKGGVGLSG